jgi:nucleoid-associated protein YgaU
MGSVVLVAALFLGLGLSLSWVVGHKEKVELSEKLTEKTVAEKKLKIDIEKTETDAEKSKIALKETEEMLVVEAEARKDAVEARLLTENRLQLTEEEKKRIEEEVQGEINELKAMVMATEEGKKRVELEERLKAEVEARKKAEQKWIEAETRRSIAEKEARERLNIELSQKTETELNEEFDRLSKEVAAARQEETKLSAEAEKLKSDVKIAAQEKAAIEEELAQKKKDINLAEGILSNVGIGDKLREELSMAQKTPGEEVPADVSPYELKSGDGWWTEEVIRYRVKKGDTLSIIAANDFIYNDWRLWVVIYKHNLHRINDPSSIYPGQILLIPKITTLGKSEINKILKEYNKDK